MAESVKQETSVEVAKRASDYLRGTLLEEIENTSPKFDGDSEQLLKFHGVYSQDNRDVRRERSLAGEELEHIFMTRVVVPGGFLTSAQWLALDTASDTVADGTIRLTTRQAIQYHGTIKSDLQSLARQLDEVLMTSFGGCGDVVRNVVMCPDLQIPEAEPYIAEVANAIAERFRPTTTAHWEIFVDGQRAASREVVNEHSFYGDTYLPRKFKIAIAHPDENCVDVFAQDLGMIPGTHPDLGEGFTFVVGGGLGRNYAHEHTFARLGEVLGFVPRSQVEEVIAAVVDAYKDLGDRTDRKRARLKYVLADAGLEAFRAEIHNRLGYELAAPLPLPANFDRSDHLGWHGHDDGTWRVGVRVAAGRIRDDETSQTRTALRKIAQALPVKFLLTPQQDIIIDGVSADERPFVDQLLRDASVREAEVLGSIERTALACPALPTCGQALTESERVLGSVVTQFERALSSRGLERRPVALRMTGCPNGCARPAVAEIGIVGRTKSTYDIYVGGSRQGDRLATLFQEKVKLADLADAVAPLFDAWQSDGDVDESFGDFANRWSSK
ncbi:MAG: NADPH-dependent assimilatory sulfite reductase hemoprotein subunit [Actinomycetes bacterium]